MSGQFWQDDKVVCYGCEDLAAVGLREISFRIVGQSAIARLIKNAASDIHAANLTSPPGV
jgi:hypothetical protein